MIDEYAKILWDYLKLNQPIEKSDCILVLGSHDIRSAEYAVSLFKEGLANYILFSGGVYWNKPEDGIAFTKCEAEEFADVARKNGIPEEKILVENRASNTEENFTYSEKLLRSKKLKFSSFILVHKPYAERRAYAKAKKIWSDKKISVTSIPLSFKEYISVPARNHILNTMVGDLQRTKIYGENGFQIPQKIPQNVWNAYEELVKLGFDKKLITF
jgi:uncharacterized SAM-binding protein YcdF (DUF218 family)